MKDMTVQGMAFINNVSKSPLVEIQHGKQSFWCIFIYYTCRQIKNDQPGSHDFRQFLRQL